jgi:hypothetical protein
MKDFSNMVRIWSTFFEQRTSSIKTGYPGLYRAIVVETNDPLQIYRIRFKCP